MNRQVVYNATLIGVLSGRRYMIDQQIGDGTLGMVYRAREQQTGRSCAIKVLTMSPVEGLAERLWRLVDDLRTVDHPVLVRPTDSGQWQGRGFLVMDLCDARSAETALARGPLAPARVRQIALDVAGALDAAHKRSLSHQALMPSSILVGTHDDGPVRLLGVGLLFAFSAGDERVTALLATPKMLPPDAHASWGNAADPRMDIYSLGAVMARLLTGHRPFGFKIEQALAARGAARTAPVIRNLNPSVSPEFEAIVQRAMAPNPHDRFRTMREFYAALEGVA
jgi:eukaryotic-like serine/threonine-protein kinase